MLDSYNRAITYLRISLTDQCNLRCRYCMPQGALSQIDQQKYLSFDQIVAVTKAAVPLGITKFRFTGGEPLLRPHISSLIEQMHAIRGVETLALTTNGLLLAPVAEQLVEAGLSSVNISLDTLEAGRYNQLTGGGNINTVLEAIDRCLTLGLPVKINMVIQDDQSRAELPLMKQFAAQKGFKLQTIALYHLSEEKQDQTLYDRPKSCSSCNRLRLLADGRLRTCLHSNNDHSINFDDIPSSLIKAITSKPQRGLTSPDLNVNYTGG